MTIHDLEIFEKVVECTNLTLLSKRIGMSQPNISIHLKSLEEELNEKLFERIGKKLIINESGKLLHSKTKDFLLQYNEIKNIFSKNKLEGKINIGSTKTLSIYFLPNLLYEYKKAHKAVDINNITYGKELLIEKIKDGSIDIGFIESEIDSPDIIKEFLKKDELVVVSADKSLSKKITFIDQLFDKDWIIRDRSSGVTEIFFTYLGELKDLLNVSLELQNTLSIKKILATYPNTISCLSLESVDQEIKNKELFKIKVKNLDFNRNYYIIYHKNKFHSALFKSFKYFIQSSVSKV